MSRNKTVPRSLCFAAFALLAVLQPDASQAQTSVKNQSDSVVTFISHRTGDNLLYKMKPDGTNITPFFGGPISDVPTLADGVTLIRQPHWTRQSPNGKYFASWVYETGIPYLKWQGPLRAMLWAGDLDGKWARIVDPDCHEEFAWSPDSKRIAFSIPSGSKHSQGFFRENFRSAEIAVCGINGSNLDFLLEQKGIWVVLDWSPDGERLLISRRYFDVPDKKVADIYEFRIFGALAARKKDKGVDLAIRGSEWAATSASRFLSKVVHDSDQMDVCDARYSPDGKSLAVVLADPKNMYAPNECADNESGRMSMMRFLGKVAIIDIATGKSQIIADFNDGICGPICWSPNGKEVLFSRYLPKNDQREKSEREHGLSIWAIGRDGNNPRFLTTGWSPDWR